MTKLIDEKKPPRRESLPSSLVARPRDVNTQTILGIATLQAIRSSLKNPENLQLFPSQKFHRN